MAGLTSTVSAGSTSTGTGSTSTSAGSTSAPVARVLVPRRGPWALLREARLGLQEASHAEAPAHRYAAAHLAALRAASALIADRARPVPGGPTGRATSRPRSAWTLLARLAPELAEWAATFAAGAPLRNAAETGRPGVVSARQADDLVRDVERFLALVAGLLARSASAA